MKRNDLYLGIGMACSLAAIAVGSPQLMAMTIGYSIPFLVQRVPPLKAAFQKAPRLLNALIYGALIGVQALPVLAQPTGSATCSTGGFFDPLSSFIVAAFTTFTADGGDLAGWVCTFLNIVIFLVILGFLLAAAVIGWQLSDGSRRVSGLIEPLSGILIFIAMGIFVFNFLL